MAYAIWHQYLAKPRISAERAGTWRTHARGETAAHCVPAYAEAMQGALLGPRFSNDEIGEWLRNNEIQAERVDEDLVARRIAELIAEGNVIGLF